jgi:hypothetical protein
MIVSGIDGSGKAIYHDVNSMDQNHFRQLWSNRPKRNLATHPITDVERVFNMMVGEKHLCENCNFLGPGTAFWTRKDGNEAYMTAMDEAGKEKKGQNPYDIPCDPLDESALMHDIVYSNPLCTPYMITESDKKLLASLNRLPGELNSKQKTLALITKKGFKGKATLEDSNLCAKLQEGSFSSSHVEKENETEDMKKTRLWIKELRREQCGHAGFTTEEPGQEQVTNLPIKTFELTARSKVIMGEVEEMANGKGLPVDDWKAIEIHPFSALNRIIRFILAGEDMINSGKWAQGTTAGLIAAAGVDAIPERPSFASKFKSKTHQVLRRGGGAHISSKKRRKNKRKHKRKHTKRKYSRKYTKRKRKGKYTKRK